ncbi:hypothetical protein HYDPIDRAFT_114844 [Hydnomerulius pinastri MD-312]|uniref:AAA+ ATPase domain-containing protein n=1 Tax=Hydnomerulius pinastri MD-312 TaxID=994086 RepID=A0A0C9VVZ4_9AGAM|nr:hypothetical protein HYDPIDRAFT_114844 [Hydnomerulius pinastri MD-312]
MAKTDTTTQQDARAMNSESSALTPEARIARYDVYFDQRLGSNVFRKTNKDKQSKQLQRIVKKKPILFVQRKMDSKGRYDHTDIEIRSPVLCEILMKIHEGVDGLELMRVPPTCSPEILLYSYKPLQDLLQLEKSKTNPDPVIIADIEVALQYIVEDHSATLLDLRNLTSVPANFQSISFPLLWSIFRPNSLIYAYDGHTEQDRILKLRRIDNFERDREGVFAEITCDLINNDGKNFGLASQRFEIRDFQGVKKIRELPLYPLEFHEKNEEIRKRVLPRGKQIANLVSRTFGEISGPGVRQIISKQDEPQPQKFMTNGRVMIDPGAFRDYCPDYIFNYTVTTPMDREHLTDEDYLICNPTILGFCFGVKEWGGFSIERLGEVVWTDKAFRSLVLSEDHKMMIHALVTHHESRASSFDDFIVGKGKGLIGLLAGLPGCGKTLTAEAVAEVAKRPLYTVTAGELGTKPSEVDKNLTWILELAQRWQAVVLLDEADVFLSRRAETDIERNALVSIFLRQLEYFQGILFLTTNLMSQFDAAFESRIHFTIHYPVLNAQSRKQIWRALLSQTSSKTLVGESDLDDLAKEPLNGRQIKNSIATAQSLSMDRGAPLSMEHVRVVLQVMRDWNKALEDQHFSLPGPKPAPYAVQRNVPMTPTWSVKQQAQCIALLCLVCFMCFWFKTPSGLATDTPPNPFRAQVVNTAYSDGA